MMHRTTASHSHSNGGGFFKTGNIFGGNKTPTSTRPSTSSGSPSTHSESYFSTSSSRTSTFSRKTSISINPKSPKAASYRSRNNSTAIPTLSPERLAQFSSVPPKTSIPLSATSAVTVRAEFEAGPKSADEVKTRRTSAEIIKTPISGSGSQTSTAPYANMLVRPGTGYQSISSNGVPTQSSFAPQPPSPTLETITYQHIQETSSKRISTLYYLRKVHEGRVYWFNTLLFNKSDLQKMPYFDSRKLARRATNYLLLGLSLPTVIDLHSSTAMEFLRTLNALLAEFESFQQAHPPDGSSSSLSRGRFPQMFKRATATSGKGRRTSSAAEIGLPMGNDSMDYKSTSGGASSAGSGSATSFPVSENDLLPGEEYMHLLTPSLPFDPDFYETFATLCDVLIDCYTRLMSLVATPKECTPLVAEMFTKADSRVRKIIVQGVVKEFEDSSRAGLKSEVAGVGRVVLGGLM